jgi:transketolase
MSTNVKIATLRSIAQRLRRISVLSTSAAGSGHPTTCLSAADLMAALFFDEMHFDPQQPDRPGSDLFVLSKGHAAPILWAALHESGAITADPMTLRRIDSDLEGHPMPRVPWVKVASGSLGQGLSAALGLAIGRRQRKDAGRIYCLMGDGETAEGSVWEAAALACEQKLDNLCAIVDVNELGQSGPTMAGFHAEGLSAKFAAFGWNAIVCDGHDLASILAAFDNGRATHGRPTVLLARTVKGKGVTAIAGKAGWHGKAIPKGPELDQALAEIGDPPAPAPVVARVRTAGAAPAAPTSAAPAPGYAIGAETATREAYGTALVRLGSVDPRLFVTDADTKNSTFAEKFKEKFPDRFVDAFIAEQNMVGMALGLAGAGYVPCVSTFSCFLTRAYDFIRMAAYSAPKHLILVGTHAGISIGEDGPSQMALEDLAMMRAVLGSTVLYPSDATATERLLEVAIAHGGLAYLRLSRPKTKVLYGPNEPFAVGGSKVLRQSSQDAVTLVAAGVTVFEALAAHEQLKADGIATRVVDAYSIKPLDVATLAKAANETKALVTVEDHSAWGGLGDAVAAEVRAPRLERLAVRDVPRSGTPTQLLSRYGIDAAHIVAAVRRVLG